MTQIDVLREADQVTFRASNGCVTVRFPDPHVAHISYEGVAYEAFVGHVIGEIEQRGQFPIVLAVDASALSTYETGFRKLWTDWMAANKPSAILILSRSRLVTMGIALANSVLGGKIRGFSSKAEFDRALAIERDRSQSASAST